MCGIAGWVDWEKDLTRERATVAEMGRTLCRRGPDAEGVWISKSAAFAHRRLIVIDPDGGAQPMTRAFGERSYTITYNGELYNTEDIRRELKTLGHTFQSYSDTEVLLLSYVQWGPACVHRLNGIFAFGIWDEANRTLFLARDRLGVKPLFYAQTGSSFLFGSEIKALLAHPGVSRKVDSEGLAEVFAVGPARTPGHGVFRDIRELRAGHMLLATPGGVRVEPYWRLQSWVHTDDLDTTTERVRELLVDTVQRQLVSDVPVCTFLSGGLDSSAVSAIAARTYREQGREPLHTYSIDFTDMEKHFQANSFQPGLDAPWAKRVAEYLSTVHHPVVFSMPELIDHLLTPLAARDLPGMADIDCSLYLFCREIKRNATVALSGESADEVFGGYPWFHREESLNADTFPWSLRLRDRIAIMSPDLRRLTRPEEYVADRYQEALAEVPRLPGESGQEARIREIGYLSITRFLPTLLDRKDRMSMATGLEVRVPFCDHRLVEYVFNIPWSMKTVGNQAKGILRSAMRGYLPDDVLARRKSPYPSSPDPLYLQTVREHCLAILADPAQPLVPLVNAGALQELAAASKQPGEHRPWFGQIMATAQLFHYLIEVNSWLREYRVELA
ncbi:MAG: asparagine synthase (glutamine-hydrolyzing) [Alicyclobacillaceae bacterium]|nr:asparagine synthase (glutamine-hydrolyzing) [Alicyclobacillaceae bacterium]